MYEKEPDVFDEIDNHKNPNEFVDADDPIADGIINGEYDDILDSDGLDTVMDYDDIDDDDEDSPARQNELVNTIVDEAEGYDEKGNPKSSIGVELQLFNVYDQTSAPVSGFPLKHCAVFFSKRYEFTEVLFEFRSKFSADMKQLWDTLEKYGQILNGIEEESDSEPVMITTVMPFSGLGSVYAQLVNPITWSLSAPSVDAQLTQIRVLYREEDILFAETDDLGIQETIAAEQRKLEKRAQFRESAEAKEEERKSIEQRRMEKLEELRKRGEI